VPTVFSDGVEGCYWDLADADGAAEIVIDLLEDPGRWMKMGMSARDRYLREFDATAVVPVLHHFLTASPSRAAV
jgi:hypothetical protein